MMSASTGRLLKTCAGRMFKPERRGAKPMVAPDVDRVSLVRHPMDKAVAEFVLGHEHAAADAA